MGRYAGIIQASVALSLAVGYYIYLTSSRTPLSDSEITKKYNITQEELNETKKNNELLMAKLKEAAGIKDK